MGGDILSRLSAVPSALTGLTSLFGMGRGAPRRNGHPGPSPAGPRPYDIDMWDARRHGHGRSTAGPCSSRAISTTRLRASPPLHLWPIDVVVSHGPSERGLISWWASRLYAFSAYPVRTWLPSGAPGGTTGTPAVRPSRSSRTGDSPTQSSCARYR